MWDSQSPVLQQHTYNPSTTTFVLFLLNLLSERIAYLINNNRRFSATISFYNYRRWLIKAITISVKKKFRVRFSQSVQKVNCKRNRLTMDDNMNLYRIENIWNIVSYRYLPVCCCSLFLQNFSPNFGLFVQGYTIRSIEKKKQTNFSQIARHTLYAR